MSEPRTTFPNTVLFTPPDEATTNESARRLADFLENLGYSRHLDLLNRALAWEREHAHRGDE